MDKTNVNVANNKAGVDKNKADISAHANELERLEDVKMDKKDFVDISDRVDVATNKNAEQDVLIAAKADVDYVNSYYSGMAAQAEKKTNERLEQIAANQTKIDDAQDVRISKNEEIINNFGYKIGDLEYQLSAGIASTVALAFMLSAMNAGETRVAGGTGYYNGHSAIALGMTGSTSTGDFNYKIGSSYTKSGGVVVGGRVFLSL